jgi:uncharacterized protein YhaN
MKLLTLRLHPFGASLNRTCAMHDGLNVLVGPNEFGKSTLTNALWHALHTSTKQTPAALQTVMGRWYPRPTGDHARITLRFEAEGKCWTLEKTWGAAPAARLQPDGEAPITNPTTVQERLNTLLRLNAATWQQVLFTNQAQLAATIATLADDEQQRSLDDVHALLNGAGAIPGDMAPAKLHGLLETRIKTHYSRWDESTSGPDNGRGISNPWKNQLGPVVKAYYAQEELREELDHVERHEREFDAVNGRLAEVRDALSKYEDFLQHGKGLRDGLARRGTLDERLERLRSEVALLRNVETEWPGTAKVIALKDAQYASVGERLSRLNAEIENANKHIAAETTRQSFKRITDAKTALDEAAQRLSGVAAVDATILAEVREVEAELHALTIKIEAQKLLATFESTGGTIVTMQRGNDATETVVLAPTGTWQGEALGKLSVQAGDLRISVKSGMEDVDALFAKREAAERRRFTGLTALGHESLAAADAAAKVHDELARELKTKEGLYTAALQGTTAEALAAEMQALALLPQTRDLPTLNKEKEELLYQRSVLKVEVDQERNRVEQWSLAYESHDVLRDKLSDRKRELSDAETERSALPAVPPGFASVQAYTEEFDKTGEQRDALQKQLNIDLQERVRLEATMPERTAEDLRRDLELKEREFQRCLAEGAALRRINEQLKIVVAERGESDPLQGFATALSEQFSALTNGRYTIGAMSGTIPTEVSGNTSLAANLLSQGTLGSLALATRLALAAVYLKDDNGFVVMDDPFTEMDPERRTAAVRAVGAFSQQRQVLYYTCHPEHARELQEVAGATPVVVE